MKLAAKDSWVCGCGKMHKLSVAMCPSCGDIPSKLKGKEAKKENKLKDGADEKKRSTEDATNEASKRPKLDTALRITGNYQEDVAAIAASATSLEDYNTRILDLGTKYEQAGKVLNPWIRTEWEGGIGMLYKNLDTGETSQEVPPCLQHEWQCLYDENQQAFYRNLLTGEMQHEPPPVLYQGHESEDSINYSFEDAQAKVIERMDELLKRQRHKLNAEEVEELDSLQQYIKIARSSPPTAPEAQG